MGGQILSLDPQIIVKRGALSGSVDGTPCASSTQQAYGYIANDPNLAISMVSVGHLTPLIDPDGAVRKVPALLCFDGQTYPTLSVASFLSVNHDVQHNGRSPSISVVKGRSFGQAPLLLKLKNWPDFSLPLNENGQIRVSYRIPKSGFIALSAVDVINHKVPKELLTGVWALVGSTAFGSGDAIPTPHGGAEGGLEVHAQLLSAALDDATPFTPIGAVWVQAVLVVLALAFLLWVSLQSSSSISALAANKREWHQRERFIVALPLGGLVWVIASYGLHAWSLLSLNYWLSWSLSATVVALCALVLTAQQLSLLRWQRTRIFENMSRFLSEPVAKQVALAPESDEVLANESDVIVMSVNLRNFDRFCASQSPELSAKLLHHYLSLINLEVGALGGDMHHIQGAEVLVVWRDVILKDLSQTLVQLPQILWDRSQDWLLAWSQTQTELLRQERELGSDFGSHGQVGLNNIVPTTFVADSIRVGRELQLEMGLERGNALLGSMGPSERRVNAVLGEPVQVAHALRAMCAELSYPTLLGPRLVSWFEEESQVTFNSANRSIGVEFKLVKLGEFILPGMTESKVVHASSVNVGNIRLQLVEMDESEKRVA